VVEKIEQPVKKSVCQVDYGKIHSFIITPPGKLEFAPWTFLLFLSLKLEFSGFFGKRQKLQLQIQKQKEGPRFKL
jgi:hypothetical protein